MRPVPIEFHIGPLVVHTYGIGLAVTFIVGYLYLSRRLKANGYPNEWLGKAFVWIIVGAIVGARFMHVLANLSYYEAAPLQIPQVWHGGLSSYGGLILGVPAGIYAARRYCPQLPLLKGLDMVAPVLIFSWGLGRILGPQFMIAGGGHPTHQWFGMYYAGQVGKRLPVPIFQSALSFVVWGISLRAAVPAAGDGRNAAPVFCGYCCEPVCRLVICVSQIDDSRKLRTMSALSVVAGFEPLSRRRPRLTPPENRTPRARHRPLLSHGSR